MNKVFRALNDPTRREILTLLRERDMTAGEIADAFAISKPSISYHLDLLRQAGLVLVVREGRYLRYSIQTTVVEEAVQWLMNLTSTDGHA